MRSEVDSFVDVLAQVAASRLFVNQYAYDGSIACEMFSTSAESYNYQRRTNLRNYLVAMRDLQPALMLVGEAPGVRGCRLTGVPFTSEMVLLEQMVPGKPMPVTRNDQPVKEATATMVWEAVGNWTRLPVMWNAFPWHPYRPNQPCTNRRPNNKELALGAPFLQEMVRWFEGVRVVAVGNSAELSLKRLGIPCTKVRHPSFGGKTAFSTGLNAIKEQLDFQEATHGITGRNT
jgi:uracil-DNA glycosylase